MERRLQVTDDIIRKCLAYDYNPRISRDNQKFAWEDAYDLAVGIGKMIIPGFQIDSDNTFAYENLSKWVVGDPTMQCNEYEGKGTRAGNLTKGLYIQGPTGTGKSVIISIFKKVASALNIYIYGQKSPGNLTWDSCLTERVCELYETSGDLIGKEPFIYCFHDLGTEPLESVYMGTRRNCMRSILEFRGDCPGKMTHITSNIPICKIGEFYGERVQSRLYQMCNPITISGADRRKK